jgi:DNA-binding MarR family transcriptional regulator
MEFASARAVLNFEVEPDKGFPAPNLTDHRMKRSVQSSANRTSKRGDGFSNDLYDQPGHLIRRAQQIAVSIFHSTFDYKVTPIQYAVLRILQDNPGIDQVTMARLCAIDTSTAANLAVRLERRGLVKRTVPSKSKRFRLLQLTPQGLALVKQLNPSGRSVSRRLLQALDKEEQKVFLHLLKKFVHLNNEESRAPLDREFAGTRNNHSPRGTDRRN